MSVFDQNLLTLENSASVMDAGGSVVRSALVADVLRGCGFGSEVEGVPASVRLRVYGESMLPTLWPGDGVEITSCSLADVRPGEIVLALDEGRLFLHRLVAATGDGFVLRGDSMPGPDPWFPADALLGRLTRGPAGNSLLYRSVLSRALGRVFCHWGAARRLALRLHGLLKNSVARDGVASAAKAVIESRLDIAAVNRCATQRQDRGGASSAAEQVAEKFEFRRLAPKGASNLKRLAVSLKRYPDTKQDRGALQEQDRCATQKQDRGAPQEQDRCAPQEQDRCATRKQNPERGIEVGKV